MANPYFQFKNFTVWHDKCAMKVGTDGVLLGVWADVNNKQHILDIGTGTGLIALMLAQRCSAKIDAIDIDSDACTQAKENIAKSPYYNRIHVFHKPLAEFKSSTKYDLIVSNPPYFVDSLKCPDQKRRVARHTDSLSPENLILDCQNLLNEKGNLALILPFDQRESILEYAQKNGFFARKETQVLPTPQATPKRLLIEFTRQQTPCILSSLTIELERHKYTDEFTSLAKDFYLKM